MVCYFISLSISLYLSDVQNYDKALSMCGEKNLKDLKEYVNAPWQYSIISGSEMSILWFILFAVYENVYFVCPKNILIIQSAYVYFISLLLSSR